MSETPTTATEAEDDDIHTVENTTKVLEDIRTLIKEDEEGDLDLYTKVTSSKPGDDMTAISVKLDDASTGLSYTLTITPIED